MALTGACPDVPRGRRWPAHLMSPRSPLHDGAARSGAFPLDTGKAPLALGLCGRSVFLDGPAAVVRALIEPQSGGGQPARAGLKTQAHGDWRPSSESTTFSGESSPRRLGLAHSPPAHAGLGLEPRARRTAVGARSSRFRGCPRLQRDAHCHFLALHVRKIGKTTPFHLLFTLSQHR